MCGGGGGGGGFFFFVWFWWWGGGLTKNSVCCFFRGGCGYLCLETVVSQGSRLANHSDASVLRRSSLCASVVDQVLLVGILLSRQVGWVSFYISQLSCPYFVLIAKFPARGCPKNVISRGGFLGYTNTGSQHACMDN